MKNKVDKRNRRKDSIFDRSLDENNPNLFWQLLRRTPIYISAIENFEKEIQNEESNVATWYEYLSKSSTAGEPRNIGRSIKKSVGIGKIGDIFEEKHPALDKFLSQFGSIMQFPLSFNTTNLPISYMNFFDAFEPILTKNIDISKEINSAVLTIHLNTNFPMSQVIREAALVIESQYQNKKKAPILEKIEKMYSEDYEIQLSAWDLRTCDRSWTEIAQTLSISKSSAENSFKRVQQLVDSITKFINS